MMMNRLSLFVSTALILLGADRSAAANPIVTENLQAGTPHGVWDLAGGVSDPNIQGFAVPMSVNKGGTIHFKVKTNALSYKLALYRIGYYQGHGARFIRDLPGIPQAQPSCTTDPIDCSNWSISASWTVPALATSGVYIAKLVRTDGVASSGSHIIFVVRDDNRGAPILSQTSDTTWQAYNQYGGNPNFSSLYNGEVRVSYDRPFHDTRSVNTFFGPEYNMVRWLERNGYDVSYTSGNDTARDGLELFEHDVFLSVGHDEYWSAAQRANVEAAVANGVHLAFLSGNEVFWKIRWDPAYRTITCYKQTAYQAVDDPEEFTGTWRDARFRTVSDPAKPENALTGTIFGVNDFRPSARILVPEADGRMRFWRSTAAANPGSCGVTELAPNTLGYELDVDADNGFRPPGLVRLSTTSIPRAPVLYGPGTDAAGGIFNYASGLATHNMTLYRHASGALVFGAGTIQWAYGLDANHLHGTNDAIMQQAMVNLLADMGVQPGSRQAELATASASTDFTPPTSNITSPPHGSSVRYGTAVTITGTASDVGGRVGGVEVSVDGGATWRRAEGRESFRYLWMASTPGTINLRSRAADDSGNLQAPSGIQVNVNCLGPCTLWPASATPATPRVNDASPVEVGVRFRSDAGGMVTGIRFYKGIGNTGVHTAHLWTGTGTLLATAPFVGETASGWQTATFSTPVSISANTTYVASYHTQGGYARDLSYFTDRGLYRQPLRALQNGGVFRYGPSGSFPDLVFQGTNYWVDVQLTPGQASPRGFFGAATPASAWLPDTSPVEVGMRFTSESDGLVTAIRFYKGSGNSGPHVVNLWGPTPQATTAPAGGGGHLLGSGTSLNETPSGWQTVPLLTPVQITAGTEYVVSYHTSSGYASDLNYFSSNLYDPPLRALNSVYRYGRSAYPQANVSNTNYWVDVVFTPTASVPYSVWSTNPAPGTPLRADFNEVELGVKLRSEIDGYVTGIRFYKHAGNTGPHTGTLWSSNGLELATGTFTGETACGWQVLQFATPVKINANTTYVASYHTSTGYARDPSYFTPGGPPQNAGTKGVWNPPLRALASGEEGGNGVFAYGPRSFPQNTFTDTNYWVDVIFKTVP